MKGRNVVMNLEQLQITNKITEELIEESLESHDMLKWHHAVSVYKLVEKILNRYLI